MAMDSLNYTATFALRHRLYLRAWMAAATVMAWCLHDEQHHEVHDQFLEETEAAMRQYVEKRIMIVPREAA